MSRRPNGGSPLVRHAELLGYNGNSRTQPVVLHRIWPSSTGPIEDDEILHLDDHLHARPVMTFLQSRVPVQPLPDAHAHALPPIISPVMIELARDGLLPSSSAGACNTFVMHAVDAADRTPPAEAPIDKARPARGAATTFGDPTPSRFETVSAPGDGIGAAAGMFSDRRSCPSTYRPRTGIAVDAARCTATGLRRCAGRGRAASALHPATDGWVCSTPDGHARIPVLPASTYLLPSLALAVVSLAGCPSTALPRYMRWRAPAEDPRLDPPASPAAAPSSLPTCATGRAMAEALDAAAAGLRSTRRASIRTRHAGGQGWCRTAPARPPRQAASTVGTPMPPDGKAPWPLFLGVHARPAGADRRAQVAAPSCSTAGLERRHATMDAGHAHLVDAEYRTGFHSYRRAAARWSLMPQTAVRRTVPPWKRRRRRRLRRGARRAPRLVQRPAGVTHRAATTPSRTRRRHRQSKAAADAEDAVPEQGQQAAAQPVDLGSPYHAFGECDAQTDVDVADGVPTCKIGLLSMPAPRLRRGGWPPAPHAEDADRRDRRELRSDAVRITTSCPPAADLQAFRACMRQGLLQAPTTRNRCRYCTRATRCAVIALLYTDAYSYTIPSDASVIALALFACTGGLVMLDREPATRGPSDDGVCHGGRAGVATGVVLCYCERPAAWLDWQVCAQLVEGDFCILGRDDDDVPPADAAPDVPPADAAPDDGHGDDFAAAPPPETRSTPRMSLSTTMIARAMTTTRVLTSSARRSGTARGGPARRTSPPPSTRQPRSCAHGPGYLLAALLIKLAVLSFVLSSVLATVACVCHFMPDLASDGHMLDVAYAALSMIGDALEVVSVLQLFSTLAVLVGLPVRWSFGRQFAAPGL